jgi:hypothetical protein
MRKRRNMGTQLRAVLMIASLASTLLLAGCNRTKAIVESPTPHPSAPASPLFPTVAPTPLVTSTPSPAAEPSGPVSPARRRITRTATPAEGGEESLLPGTIPEGFVMDGTLQPDGGFGGTPVQSLGGASAASSSGSSSNVFLVVPPAYSRQQLILAQQAYNALLVRQALLAQQALLVRQALAARQLAINNQPVFFPNALFVDSQGNLLAFIP